jgi:hypothetical protein
VPDKTPLDEGTVSAGDRAAIEHSGDRLQPPGRPSAGPVGPVVEGGAFVAQSADLRQNRLLGRIRFHVLPVARQPEAKRVVADAFALAALVVEFFAADFRGPRLLRHHAAAPVARPSRR